MMPAAVFFLNISINHWFSEQSSEGKPQTVGNFPDGGNSWTGLADFNLPQHAFADYHIRQIGFPGRAINSSIKGKNGARIQVYIWVSLGKFSRCQPAGCRLFPLQQSLSRQKQI
jgi:hypothetical protein